ncbi:MAG: 16S rRNA (cytidine(1402)-2'-O)-methyltransferase [Proteobacteria bacterium]|nr:16S rRNA (cytidine(1402)-2'-O)-methyltransferase [Pseudomonadota bacterium]
MALKFGLYVTATPIGNLGDITLRALEVLKGADAILCEDTRITSRLLNRYDIKKPLIAYHEHNADRVRPGIIQRLENKEILALVSDAGSPLISDPGYKLVRAAQDKKIPVYPIPGPAAPVAALMAAGLPTDKFYFAGFLPSKQGARLKALEALKNLPATLVFFESPRRVVKTLGAMVEVFGPGREAALAREMTKIYEEVIRLPLGDLLKNLETRAGIKGEIVLLVGPADGNDIQMDAGKIDQALKVALKTMSIKEAAAVIATLTGKPRKELYTRALELKGKA